MLAASMTLQGGQGQRVRGLICREALRENSKNAGIVSGEYYFTAFGTDGQETLGAVEAGRFQIAD